MVKLVKRILCILVGMFKTLPLHYILFKEVLQSCKLKNSFTLMNDYIANVDSRGCDLAKPSLHETK